MQDHQAHLERMSLIESTPLQVTSSTNVLYKAYDPFSTQTVQLFLNRISSCAGNLDVGPVYASQIKKLRKRICRVDPAPLWASSYTQYLLHKAQDPFSACRQSELFLNRIFILCPQFGCGPVYASQIKTQEENLRGGTSSLLGQFLNRISLVQSSRSIQCTQTVQLFLNRISSCAGNLEVAPVYASQIKKLRKRICRVDPAPLWASSYTQYLLHKAQDPFSACRQSELFLNRIFILCPQFGCGPVYASQIKTQEENLQGGTSSLVDQFLHASISCTKLKIHWQGITVQLVLNNFVLATWIQHLNLCIKNHIYNFPKSFQRDQLDLL